MKMGVLKELWQQAYRVEAVDYIRKHSDSKGAGTRSYNYKVRYIISTCFTM